MARSRGMEKLIKEIEIYFFCHNKMSRKSHLVCCPKPCAVTIAPTGTLTVGMVITILISSKPCTKKFATVLFSGQVTPVVPVRVPLVCGRVLLLAIPPGAVSGPIAIFTGKCCPVLFASISISAFPLACLVDPVCSLTSLCNLGCAVVPSGRTLVVSTTYPATCATPTSAALCFTTIQGAVNMATTGDSIVVCPGTYTEQVIIPAGKNGLVITSQVIGGAVIQADATLNLFGKEPGILSIRSTCVTVRGFTVQGPATFDSCNPEFYGIVVDQGGTAIIDNNHVTNIRDSIVGLNGCQRGHAIAVETKSSARITNNLVDNYQKTGIRIRGIDACGEIFDNTATGTGFNPVNLAANNGIQVEQGGSALVRRNRVSNHIFFNTLPPSGADSAGILLFQPTVVCVQDNDTSDNQIGISLVETKNAQVSSNTSNNNHTTAGPGPLGDGWGILVDSKSSDNTISLNTALNNSTFDVEDDSTGTKSCCTSNIWLCNTCRTDNKGGCLCGSRSAVCTGVQSGTCLQVVCST